jgi:hypothetical protein
MNLKNRLKVEFKQNENTMKKKMFCNSPYNSIFELQKTLATHYMYTPLILMDKLHELQSCNSLYIQCNSLQLNCNSIKTTHFQLLFNSL